MTPTRLRLTDRSTKWGLVTVWAADGSLAREVVIDSGEADRVANSVNGWPSCVSQEEWESGRAQSATYSVWPGQASELPDGMLVVCLDLAEQEQRVKATILGLHRSEWSEVGGVVGVRGHAMTMIRRAGW